MKLPVLTIEKRADKIANRLQELEARQERDSYHDFIN